MQLDEFQKQLRAARRNPSSPGHRRIATEARPAERVALGADHGGFLLKENLKAHLLELGYEVHDLGTMNRDPVDYPDFAVAVARQVASGACRCGIVIDGAGIGSCMAANKVRGVRAATCQDESGVRYSREHNNANVLVLGAGAVHAGHARRLVRIWLTTPFAGGRHARRVGKIDALDGER